MSGGKNMEIDDEMIKVLLNLVDGLHLEDRSILELTVIKGMFDRLIDFRLYKLNNDFFYDESEDFYSGKGG